jgi:hypothetical protein
MGIDIFFLNILRFYVRRRGWSMKEFGIILIKLFALDEFFK